MFEDDSRDWKFRRHFTLGGLHLWTESEAEIPPSFDIFLQWNIICEQNYQLWCSHYWQRYKNIRVSNPTYSLRKSNTDGGQTRSLCPALGKTYATIHEGTCPKHLQHPYQKELPISFIGLPPYIKYSPFGGSDPHTLSIMAKKFGFRPKYIPARSVDQGMVHEVCNHVSI